MFSQTCEMEIGFSKLRLFSNLVDFSLKLEIVKPKKYWGVGKLVIRLTVNQDTTGSNPVAPAKLYVADELVSSRS